MAIFVDGYNALHEPKLAGLSEAGLCRALSRAAVAYDWKGPLRVVCDGKPKPGNDTSPVADVQLLYSGPNATADDLIIDLIEAWSAPRQLVVVSSDRVIQKAARRRGAVSWSSAKFARELQAALAMWYEMQGQSSTQATHPMDHPTTVQMGPQQVIGWLRYFGFDADGRLLSEDGKKHGR